MFKIQMSQTPSNVIASEAKQSQGIASSLSLLAMTTFSEGILDLFRISIFEFRIFLSQTL
jgi:hypothetical protein